jgi:hypothetical protein
MERGRSSDKRAAGMAARAVAICVTHSTDQHQKPSLLLPSFNGKARKHHHDEAPCTIRVRALRMASLVRC